MKTIVSWCSEDKCDPCKPLSVTGLPPGDWKPPPITAFQMVYYMIQEKILTISEAGYPAGTAIITALIGIGAQLVTSQGIGPFGWSYGPNVRSDTGYDYYWSGPHIEVGIDYFDGTGPHFATTHYSTLDAVLAVGQAFNQYYFP